MGRFEEEVTVEDGVMKVGDHEIKMLMERDPAVVPVEGPRRRHRHRVHRRLQRPRHPEAHRCRREAGHLDGPAKDKVDETVVLGVNDDQLDSDDIIVSNASCTTNSWHRWPRCWTTTSASARAMTTVHAYTNDQVLADVPTRICAAAGRQPRTSSRPRQPALQPRSERWSQPRRELDGMAMRVPVPDGSTVDLVVELDRDVTVEEVNAAVGAAAEGPMAGILEYVEDPIVSTDIIGNPHSSIFDAGGTQVLGGNLVKVMSWYDNEWGYSNRVVDLAERLADVLEKEP